MKMWKKIIMDFLTPTHLSKSVRATGSKIGYIPPAIKVWKGSVDIYNPENHEIIWYTIFTTSTHSEEAPISHTVFTTSTHSEEAPISASIMSSLANSKEIIPVTVVSVLAGSTEVGGV